MENVTIINTNEKTQYRANAETTNAKYDLNYEVENGNLNYVQAQVTTKDENPISGSLTYNRLNGYRINGMPYDQTKLASIMTDFADVVSALQEE